MRARLFAVGCDYCLRAALALVLAAPLAALVSSTGVTRFPESDRLLFEPGGLFLAEVGRALWSAFAPFAQTELAVACFFVVLLVVPYGMVLAAWSEEAPRPLGELWWRTGTRFPVLLALKGLAFLAQALTLSATLGLAALLRATFADGMSRRADLTALGACSFGLVALLTFGIIRDLASAAAVVTEADTRGALAAGWDSLLRAPRAVARGVAVPLVAGAGLVGLGAASAGALDVARPGTWRVVAVLLIHQCVMLGWTFARAYWLRLATRVVASQPADAASIARRYT
jgi:hypothetical protein